MRIVFLANPIEDYLQDLVYHGLVALLGADRVTEYPRVERYHRTPPSDARYPQLWFGVPEGERPGFADALAAADAVVVGSLREHARPLVAEVLARRRRPPVVFLDGEDDAEVLAVRDYVDVYFKREILVRGTVGRLEEERRRMRRLARGERRGDPLARRLGIARAGDQRLRPLPFAWVGRLPTPREKDHDVSFLFAATSPERRAIRERLGRLAADGLRVRLLADGERLDWWSYMEVLARSRIGLSVRGLGYDTFRYWEVPAAGALLLAEEPRTVIPGNFEPGREAAFAPVDELVDRIPALLAGDTEQVARAGHERLLAAHTSVHRARAVLDALAELS